MVVFVTVSTREESHLNVPSDRNEADTLDAGSIHHQRTALVYSASSSRNLNSLGGPHLAVSLHLLFCQSE